MRRKQAPSPASPLINTEKSAPGLTPWTITHSNSDLHGLGDRTVLRHPCLALICSVQCPGSVVIKTFDAIRELRDAGIVAAGGFHSPMEKECLEFLLRGSV
jgi:hypothetical protein